MADLDDLAVVDCDHRRPGLGEDVGRHARRIGVDGDRGVAGLHVLVGDLGDCAVGVLGRRRNGKASLDEPGQRPDEGVGHPADELGSQEHRLDVPRGVVVRKDRLREVLRCAGRVEIPRGRKDRVHRVVGVRVARSGDVHPVALPRRRQELHPANGARARHGQVAPVVGLDLVDRRQHLPRDVVLDPGGLVDRQQEGRDLEGVDEEVRDPEWGGPRDRERRRGDRRRRAALMAARRLL